MFLLTTLLLTTMLSVLNSPVEVHIVREMRTVEAQPVAGWFWLI